MKKSFIIIVLCLLQGACSVYHGWQAEDRALLSYTELATEITVGFEQLDVPEDNGNETGDTLGSP